MFLILKDTPLFGNSPKNRSSVLTYRNLYMSLPEPQRTYTKSSLLFRYTTVKIHIFTDNNIRAKDTAAFHVSINDTANSSTAAYFTTYTSIAIDYSTITNPCSFTNTSIVIYHSIIYNFAVNSGIVADVSVSTNDSLTTDMGFVSNDNTLALPSMMARSIMVADP